MKNKNKLPKFRPSPEAKRFLDTVTFPIDLRDFATRAKLFAFDEARKARLQQN